MISDVADARRALKGAFWPVIQTAVASGLAWYITHNVLGRSSPFFAPIAAAVALSSSAVLRGQWTVQLVGGAALGIVVGIGAVRLGGTGPAAAAVSIFLAVAIGRGVLGQGLMFVNQTAASAILVITLHVAGTGSERLVDALIGGGVALTVSLVLFPTRPLPLIHQATRSVLAGLQGGPAQLEHAMVSGRPMLGSDTLSASRRIHANLAGMTQALASAREIVRWAPRRWRLRGAVRDAAARTSDLDLLADSVLSVLRAASAAMRNDPRQPPALADAVHELSAGLGALAEPGGAQEAADRAARAHGLAEQIKGITNLFASTVSTCAEDLSNLANSMA